MLGVALGNWREAARRCGLRESRVLNWVVRYNWIMPARAETPPKPPDVPTCGQRGLDVVKPAEILTQTLHERKERSALHLSKYVADASENLAKSRGDLLQARIGEHLARIRTALWPETAVQSAASLEVTLTDRNEVRAMQAQVRALLAG
jgi:hypothetical protein